MTTENIKILMEDTGCNQHEAEQALELAGGNLEQAIINIGVMLKNITAYKAKIKNKQKNIYGLIHIITNNKNLDLLRLSSVMTYNPVVYEQEVSMDWFSFEKAIFYYRLEPGTIEQYTRMIDTDFAIFITDKLKQHKIISVEDMKNMLEEFFVLEDIEIEIVAQELTLREFRRLPNSEHISISDTSKLNSAGEIKLDTVIMEDDLGKKIDNIVAEDVVLATITDTRDIAHYLGHLIGARKDNEMISIPVTVKNITKKDDIYTVYLKYADLITGVATVKSGKKLKVLSTKKKPWWMGLKSIFTKN